MTIHLKAFSVREFEEPEAAHYPFNLDVVKSLKRMTFSSPLTFFVGENGSGKSTILETIACAADSITVGSENARKDKSLEPIQNLSRYFRLAWDRRTHRGFFLRAEDFFGYIQRMRRTKQELQRESAAVELAYKGRSKLAADLARLPYANELNAMERRYGEGLDTYSHGESFLTLFQSRFVPDGLYLLDEPEAALSPGRQLTFISALKGMLAENSQFIIATHSPIILAFPDSTILSFDGGQIHPVQYQQLENVTLTRDFLNNPQSFLRHL